MNKHLVEIKARSTRHEQQRGVLLANHAEFHGVDHQIDHYFNVPDGRLKLRSGAIENSLIFYRRPNQSGPKDSTVVLSRFPGSTVANEVANTLHAALGTWAKVDKQREIYYLDNVKFHLDTVKHLGTFVEIEAIGDSAEEHQQLLRQVLHYQELLGITEAELIENSYSDLLQ